MTSERKANRHERRAAKARKWRRFQLSLQDLPAMADIMFEGLPDGWVAMAGNPQGRRCVELVFPDAHIAWRNHDPDSALPADWRAFSLNLPDVANATRHRLPAHIMAEVKGPLAGCTPGALALLLALAARDQGARVAFYHEGKVDIFLPGAGEGAVH